MLDSLTQRRGFTIRTYTLGEDGIAVRERGFLHRESYRFAYEALSPDAFETTLYNRWALALLAVFVVLAAVVAFGAGIGAGTDGTAGVLFYVGFAILFGVLAWFSWHRLIGFSAGEGAVLVFESGKPDDRALSTFLSELENRRIAHLRHRFLLDGDEPPSTADELHKLAWLHEKGAITEDEFEKLKHDLIFGQGERPLPPELLN